MTGRGKRPPYNPALDGPQVHDRRAREINRGSAGHVVAVEVDDPYEDGAKISAIRSSRDDPLGDHLARGHIDQAQYLAGREFQKHFGIAERGPRAIQLLEAVDGNPPIETLTSAQLMAGKWLAKCYVALGTDGTRLVQDMLIHARTARQMAAAHGLQGAGWERYFARRLWQCLNELALVYGFASGR
jgi:hypothetical protein